MGGGHVAPHGHGLTAIGTEADVAAGSSLSNEHAVQVAALIGDLAYVDGKDVSAHGNSFELLPGCHVVGTPEKWGRVDYAHSIWANIGNQLCN